MRDKIYLLGPIDMGNVPTNGVTMKNQLFYKRFSELFSEVKYIDTWGISRKPWLTLYILFALLFRKKYKFIVSGGHSSRSIFNILYKLHLKRDVYFWVAGGNLASAVRDGLYNVKVLNHLKALLVQGVSMQRELNSLGVQNAVYVPNSKPIYYTPNLNKYKTPKKVRFVFLSRIHPNKGCDDIFECVRKLNLNGYKDKFEVTFFGSIFETYKESFQKEINEIDNVKYEGFLNLTNDDGYRNLSSYDVMLFPTFWSGEGFPGVVVDAYIAGLPIIASDWNLNTEVVENGKTGFIINTKNVEQLHNAMLNFIKEDVNLPEMRKYCLEYAKHYEFRNVLSEKLMNSLGFN